jgi:hypothetical protein
VMRPDGRGIWDFATICYADSAIALRKCVISGLSNE